MEILFFLITIILGAIIHEYAHGWMADRLGDPTARLAGRLTLNPLAHIDMVGTVILPLSFLLIYLMTGNYFLFAYAKPVPVNPYNIKRGKSGLGWVSFAGPASNLFIALAFGIFIRIFGQFFDQTFINFLAVIVYANILLAIFNLVPLPPLDGSKILFAVLPDKFNNFKIFLQTYGIFIFFFFIFYLYVVIDPIIRYLFEFFTGIKIGFG